MGSTYFSKRIQHLVRKHVLNAVKKPKAFKSVEDAKAWADENGLKGYTLRDLREGKGKPKIKVFMKG
jgi:hypothetical protein